MIERYRAIGPDGEVSFSVDSSDQGPLATAAIAALARRRGVSPDLIAVTFTKFVPINAAARQVMPHPKR